MPHEDRPLIAEVMHVQGSVVHDRGVLKVTERHRKAETICKAERLCALPQDPIEFAEISAIHKLVKCGKELFAPSGQLWQAKYRKAETATSDFRKVTPA